MNIILFGLLFISFCFVQLKSNPLHRNPLDEDEDDQNYIQHSTINNEYLYVEENKEMNEYGNGKIIEPEKILQFFPEMYATVIYNLQNGK
jgi:hypothetical protein